MFGRNVKNTETLNGVNISFVDTENITCICNINTCDAIVERVNDFLDAFLKGYSSIAHKNKSYEYFVYGMVLRAHREDGCDDIQNERSKVFSPALTCFNLPVSDKFFVNSDYATIKLFVALGEKAKEGVILLFKVNY